MFVDWLSQIQLSAAPICAKETFNVSKNFGNFVRIPYPVLRITLADCGIFMIYIAVVSLIPHFLDLMYLVFEPAMLLP